MDKKVYIHNSVSLVPYTDITDNADRYCDKISLMCISSIKKLFSETEVADKNIPVFFGSSFSSLKSLHDFNMVYEKKGALSVNPGLFPNTVLNSPSCRASI